MRTGNLPANMKKNRVLQIIPCKLCVCACVRVYVNLSAPERTQHINRNVLQIQTSQHIYKNMFCNNTNDNREHI